MNFISHLVPCEGIQLRIQARSPVDKEEEQQGGKEECGDLENYGEYVTNLDLSPVRYVIVVQKVKWLTPLGLAQITLDVLDCKTDIRAKQQDKKLKYLN